MELQRKQKEPVELSGAMDEPDWDADALLQHADMMASLKERTFSKAKANIDEAQKKDKLYYDLKHADHRVSFE